MIGIGVSKGIGMGKVYIYTMPKINVVRYHIDDTTTEINRFKEAIEIATADIDKLHNESINTIGSKDAEVFTAHKLMLNDPELIQSVVDKINTENINSEYALKEEIDYYLSMFNSINDEYLKTRIIDLKDISNRLFKVLLKIEEHNFLDIDENFILVSDDLTPSDTARINKKNLVGILTETGGKTSHTSIFARTLGIPAVVGINGITLRVNKDDNIIIDGESGRVIINPTIKELEDYKKLQLKLNERANVLQSMKFKETKSKDGYKVKLMGNIGSLEDVEKLLDSGGEGVGLFRSEFLFMDRDKLPTEEEQFEAYKSVVEKLENKPVIIRTLDAGGDKDIPYLNLPKEMNPFLGFRAIRISLHRIDIFKVQLRAILRASAFGNVKIMFPMISNLNEIRECKRLIQEIKSELRMGKVLFDEDIEVGIMVEVPAVAINSRAFAKEVDFFSIGTNDIIQYTLAVDRGSQDIAYLYNQYDPSVLSLIKMTIENGHLEGIKVGMCGESASDKKLLPVFLAMGLDEFSMSASSILSVRYQLKNTSRKDVCEKLYDLLSLPTAEEVEKFIDENILNNL